MLEEASKPVAPISTRIQTERNQVTRCISGGHISDLKAPNVGPGFISAAVNSGLAGVIRSSGLASLAIANNFARGAVSCP